jgi:RNA-binding protein YhbY
MYFKKTIRHNQQTGILEGYYRLVESYRNISNRVCHRTLLNIGFLNGITIEQLNQIQYQLNDRLLGKVSLFDSTDSTVREQSEQLWNELIAKKRIDHPDVLDNKCKRLVDLDTIKHRDVREIGAEWIGYHALKQLGVSEFLNNAGWEEDKIQLSLTQIISRAVYPASELETSRWIRENSAICELTGVPLERITKDLLYKNALELYRVKEPLEKYLSQRTNELFDIEDKIVLFDLTNTYFEGRMIRSKIAKRGRSKERRNDCKIIVLALVINMHGFIKYSSIFEGNFADCRTLPHIIEKLRKQTSTTTTATVVIDAGIATEDNLKLIEAKGYKYVCVSRKSISDFEAVRKDGLTFIKTKTNETLSVEFVKTQQSNSVYLKVKSPGKFIKEKSMKSLFEERFEDDLQKIKLGLTKKHTTKSIDKIHQRIGRYKQKYPSVSKYYDIEVIIDENNRATELNWVKNVELYQKATAELGVYLISTNLDISQEQTLWDIYNTIREVEYSFRTLKTDLDLRPIYHKTDNGTLAHLHLGLLAYWLVNTIRYQLKQQGVNNCWKEIVRIGNTQKIITTSGQNQQGITIATRKCSEANQKLLSLYDILKIQSRPFTKRKSVVHKPKLKKSQIPHKQNFSP